MDEKPPDFRQSLPVNQPKGKKESRRRWLKAVLGLGIAGGVAAGYSRFWESSWLRTSSHLLPHDKFKTGKKLRLLHLSDFHLSSVVPFELIEKSIEMGLEQKPDATFITGDFITSKASDQEFDRYVEVLRALSEKAPTFACLGNHDGGKWSASTYGYKNSDKVETTLSKAGVYLLRNQSENIFIKGEKIVVVGLDDLWSGTMKPSQALRPQNPDGKATNRPPVLVMCHNPDSKDELASYDWDLMLCGHTHGGQCILPLLGTPFAPVEDHRFVEGLHEWKGRLIHITRGVGNLHGVRFNCRPEISLLETASPTSAEE